MRFRIFGDTSNSVATPMVVGVVEGFPDTLPNSEATIGPLLSSVAHCGASETKWSKWVGVPRAFLSGQLPWYQTSTGTMTSVEEVPATLVYSGSTAGAVQVEIVFSVQFKAQVPTTSTPVALALTDRIRKERLELKVLAEKRRLMEVLSASTSPPVLKSAELKIT